LILLDQHNLVKSRWSKCKARTKLKTSWKRRGFRVFIKIRKSLLSKNLVSKSTTWTKYSKRPVILNVLVWNFDEKENGFVYFTWCGFKVLLASPSCWPWNPKLIRNKIEKSGKLTSSYFTLYSNSLTKFLKMKLIHLPETEMLKDALKISSNT